MKTEDKTVCFFFLKKNNIFFKHFYHSVLAKLAISIARKMNALIFLVPEDIVDVRPRLVRLWLFVDGLFS